LAENYPKAITPSGVRVATFYALTGILIEIGIFSRQCLGTRRIPDLKTLGRESRAWNRRMNRDRIKINWKFDRRAARRKFGYRKKYFKRSET
jgi:hypothetical protein